MSRGRIPVDRYRERLGRAQDAVGRAGDAAALVGVGTDLRWLIGYEAMPLERLTLLVLRPSGRPILIVPRLERSAALAAPGAAAGYVDLVTWDETDDPIRNVVQALNGSPNAATPGEAAALRVSDSLRAAFLLRLQAALPHARFGLASAVTSPLRQVKDADEIALLTEAAHAADRTVAAIFAGRLIDRTEADVAREVRERLVAEGHDTADFAIVASGPNAASPHHEASARVIGSGDSIVLDIGGSVGGYHSDVTRTAWVTGARDGAPEPAFAELFSVLLRAQAAARSAARPGVACMDVDAAARDIIDAAGFADAFFHRTGHGIGLDGHEDPYLVSGNAAPLAAGNAFSIEPGIYLEDRFGARIEDIVVCSAEGSKELNRADRDLAVVTGLG
jgi:Xaa-Pro aminopeptidase